MDMTPPPTDHDDDHHDYKDDDYDEDNHHDDDDDDNHQHYDDAAAHPPFPNARPVSGETLPPPVRPSFRRLLKFHLQLQAALAPSTGTSAVPIDSALFARVDLTLAGLQLALLNFKWRVHDAPLLLSLLPPVRRAIDARKSFLLTWRSLPPPSTPPSASQENQPFHLTQEQRTTLRGHLLHLRQHVDEIRLLTSRLHPPRPAGRSSTTTAVDHSPKQRKIKHFTTRQLLMPPSHRPTNE